MQLSLTICNSIVCCSHQLAIPAHFTLHQCGPNLIIALGHSATSCTTWCAIGPYQKHWPWLMYTCLWAVLHKETSQVSELRVLQNSRVSCKVMPCKITETRLLLSVESSSSVQLTHYVIECIRLLKVVMWASATLPLSGTVVPYYKIWTYNYT